MIQCNERLTAPWWALRIGFAVGPFLAGLDKFFNVLVDWNIYLSPVLAQWLPFGGDAFLRMAGLVEMLVGIAILTRYTRYAAYIASGWLLAIAANLLTTGMFYDVAVRDVEMAVAAFALARMTEARQQAGIAERNESRPIGHLSDAPVNA